MSRVAVILVNWNGWRDTLECLESLLELTWPDLRVIVCDNGSTDDSLQRIAAWAAEHGVGCRTTMDRPDAETGGAQGDDPWLTLIGIGENRGFAGGCNAGLRHALAGERFDYFWLLNNDTVAAPDSLTRLVERMNEDARIGICGSTLVHYHDRRRIQVLGGGWYCRWLGVPWHYGRFSRYSGAICRQRAEARMNYVEGASMLVSRCFLDEVGLLCEEYFLYFEEADWALRAKGRFRLGYAPESIVYHKVGASIGTSSNPARKSRTCDYYNIRNRILFTRRYHPAALVTVCMVIMLEILLRVAVGRWDLVRGALNALREGARQ